MALENQASSDRAGYRIPVQITESGHVDLARVRWFTSSEVGAAISLKSIWRGWDRCRLWLWPQAALSKHTTRRFFPAAFQAISGVGRGKREDCTMDEELRHLAEEFLNTGYDSLSERERKVISHIAR